MGSEPQLRDLPFKFKLGEFTLFVIRRPVLVENSTLRDVATGHFDPNRPPDYCPDHAVGILRRSYRTDGPLPVLTRIAGWTRYVPHQFPRHYISFQGSFEQYLQNFSPKTRSTLRRKVRRMLDAFDGAVECRIYREPSEMKEFYEAARAISSKTYQEKLLDAGLPSTDDFRHDMESLAKEGLVCGFLLWAAGQPVSYIYCPAQNGTLVYTNLGYDPRFRQYSPGTVLQWLVLEKLFSEGRYEIFDFSEGAGEHKRLFATGCYHCADIYWMKATLANAAVVRGQAFVNRVSWLVVKGLDKLGLKARVKRFFRFRLGGQAHSKNELSSEG